MAKRIAVVGTGANGSSVGAALTQAGLDVTLIDQWPAHVEAMRANGLRVSLPGEEQVVPVRALHVCDLATLNKRFDIVLVMVKAYDTRWSCELIKPYLSNDGLVVGVQNAMTAEEIANIVGSSRTIGCVIELSSELRGPGHVERNNPRERTWLGIGSFHASTKGREGEVEEVLNYVGKVTLTDDILSAKWMKLIVNAMTMGPQALMGLKAQEAMHIPEMREIALRAGSEALAAGQRLGYTIQPIFGLTREEMEGSNRVLEMLVEKLVKDVGPAGRATVLYDHENGRLSEVDRINGLVADELERQGIPAPVNRKVVDLTHRIHSGGLKPDIANLPLLMEALKG